MRNNTDAEKLRIDSLKELDALVGKYVVLQNPQVFWEEQHACLRFDSIEEALEAMHDPYFQQFIPEDARPHTALTEIQEYRAYSSDIMLAWEVVEKIGGGAAILRICREGGHWVAAFGEAAAATSRSAPVAICLAALRLRGIDVELITEWAPVPTASTRTQAAA
jgi:hypothetical protein